MAAEKEQVDPAYQAYLEDEAHRKWLEDEAYEEWLEVCNEDRETLKFSVTLPGQIAEDLAQWAKIEGRSRGNLAAFLLEVAVKTRFKGRYGLKGYPPIQKPSDDT